MSRNWLKDLKKFEQFLQSIDLSKYAHLRAIKTVEQDLPRELLPLEIYYKYYWDSTDFKEYDEIFEIYWNNKLNPHIYEFIKKFFYGCSIAFVEEGFKARLYRIWMSILTQFHFQYLWNALFVEKLESNAELDSIGIDAVVVIHNKRVGLQIKKISYRREASDRRFTRRQQKFVPLMVEIPYLVIDLDELKQKIINPRVRESSKERYKSALEAFDENFIKLSNGFVIFRKEYVERVYETIKTKAKKLGEGKITYDQILEW